MTNSTRLTNSSSYVGTIASILSMSIAFGDLTLSLLFDPFRFSSFAEMLLPFVVSISFVSVVYLILWIPFRIVVRRRSGPLIVYSIVLAIFVANVYAFFKLAALLLPRVFSNGFQNGLFTIAVVFLSGCIAATSFLLVSYFARSERRHILGRSFLALPVVLGILWLSKWFYRGETNFTFSWSFFLFSSLFVVAAITVIRLFQWMQYRTSTRILTACFLTLLVALFSSWLFAKTFNRSAVEAVSLQSKPVPRVILIVIDTLRAKALSCYGSSVKTPNIDQLAQDGALFHNAYASASWTLPSMTSLMTGHSPLTHRTLNKDSQVPDALQTLAEYMSNAGYLTAAIGDNYYIVSGNLDRGFKNFDFFPKRKDVSISSLLLSRLFRHRYRVAVNTPALTERVIQWLQTNQKQQFFLYIHYFDPHIPYSPPKHFVTESLRQPNQGSQFSVEDGREIRSGRIVLSHAEAKWIQELYEGEVRYVDANIKRLTDTLKQLNIYENTLIILTSDHGEELWEHNGTGHTHTLYNELLRVPLIVKPPSIAVQSKIEQTVSTDGVMPTILEFCRIQHKDEYLSERSFVPFLKGEAQGDETQPLAVSGSLVSLIFDRYKYIKSIASNREELYDLIQDPGEYYSLTNSSPEIMEKARHIMALRYKEAEELRRKLRIVEKVEPLDDEAKRQLKAVGYLQ